MAVQFCLDQAGIGAHDVEYVVFYEKPLPKFERVLTTMLSTWPRSRLAFREAMITWLTEKLWIKDRIRTELVIERDKVLFVEHHLSHAASAFLLSLP